MRPSLRSQLQKVRDTMRPRRRWCDGKIAHRSLGKAQAHARALNARHAREQELRKERERTDRKVPKGYKLTGEAVAYECRTCLKFHVGNLADAKEGSK